MSRISKLSTRISKGAGAGLLDIPHPVILQYRTPDELIQEFKTNWGEEPSGVVLPVTVTDGLLFDIPGIGLPSSKYKAPREKFLGWIESVAAFAGKGLDIYLLLDVTLDFVTTDALHIVDIVGAGAAQVCIGNERAREIMSAILMTGMDLVLDTLNDENSNLHEKSKLAGIVLDVVNLFPMGTGNKGRMELTCFCESCLEQFKSPGSDSNLLDKFRTFPNPWNLVLKDAGSGVTYIDNLPPDITPKQIVGLSRQKAFDEIFGQDNDDLKLKQYAEDLLKYMEVRHRQVVESLKDIFDQALNFEGGEKPSVLPKRIVLSEGVHYDWTSGLQLERLDEAKGRRDLCPIDEIWFNSTSSAMYTSNIPFRSYMWKRSRYTIDAFFSTAANAADADKRRTTGIGRLAETRLKEVLRDRLGTAIGAAEKGKVSLSALPDLQSERKEESAGKASQRIGFIGVALTREIGEDFIRDIQIPEGKPAESSSNESEVLSQLLRMVAQQGEMED
jgi:hypothetical protein